MDERIVGFAIAASLPLLLAFRGGSYDILARQEFGLVLWWGIALLLLFGWLPMARPTPPARAALLMLLIVLAWTGLSLFWTESLERTGIELARLASLAGIVVLAYLGLNRSSWAAAANGLLFAILALPVLALVGRLAPDVVPWADTGDFMEGRRLIAPLGYWNALGAWSAMAVGMGLINSAHRPQPMIRMLSLAAVPVAGTVIYLTYSRGGIAGAVLACVLALVLGRNRITIGLHAMAALAATIAIVLVLRGQASIAEGLGGEGGAIVAAAVLVATLTCGWIANMTRRGRTDRLRLPVQAARRAKIAGVTGVIVVVVALGPSITSGATNQFFGSGYPSEEGDPAARLVSLEGSRDQVWGSALRAVASHPVGGTGPGTFEFWWSRDSEEGEVLRDAHSLYLETLAELGLPGFIFLIAFLVAVAAAAIKSRKSLLRARDHGASTGLLVAFLVFLFHAGIDWMWESTAVVAVALASVAIAGAADAPARRGRGARLGIGRFVGVILAIVAGAAQVPGIVATERVRASADALAFDDAALARELADDAVTAEPWAATPYAARALAAVADGAVATAVADSEAALDREPTNWRLWRLNFALLLSAGELEQSVAALDRMVELNPRSEESAERLERAARQQAAMFPD